MQVFKPESKFLAMRQLQNMSQLSAVSHMKKIKKKKNIHNFKKI